MAGTLITQFTSANSSLHTNYFDPLVNQNTNFMALDIRKPGIYSGGYLTPVGTSAVSLSNLSCEITDSGGSGNQVRLVTTGSPISISVSSTAAPALVVLRWTYTKSSSANYPSIYTVAQGSQNATDLIVGTYYTSGPSLYVDYGVAYPTYLRSDPTNILDLCLKVEPVTTLPYALTSGVLVRSGKISYGINTFTIPTQIVSVSSSIGTSGYYQNVPIQLNTSGVFYTPTTGTPTSGSNPTAPAYGNLVTLAEVVVQNVTSVYSIISIKDVRCFTNSSVTLNGILPSQVGNSGLSLITNGTNVLWGNATYAP